MVDLEKKAARAKEADAWLEKIVPEFSEDMMYCLHHSYTELPEEEAPITGTTTETKVFKQDVVTCLFAGQRRNPEAKYCVLNFASWTYPGGGFRKGSCAQEEDLCIQSGLYPVLDAYRNVWYAPHRAHYDPIHNDDFIYIKDVPFFKGNQIVYADVLTICAVNFWRLEAGRENEGLEAMRARQELAFKIPHQFGATHVLLGAWGCGVFRNDPTEVASKWKALTAANKGMYVEVVHPITDRDKYDAFRKVYK